MFDVELAMIRATREEEETKKMRDNFSIRRIFDTCFENKNGREHTVQILLRIKYVKELGLER